MIRVDSSALEDGIQRLNLIQKQLENIESDLTVVSRELNLNHSVFQNESLSTLYQVRAISRQEQSTVQMQKALEAVNTQYQNTERTVQNQAGAMASAGKNSQVSAANNIRVPNHFDVADIRKALDRFRPGWTNWNQLYWTMKWFESEDWNSGQYHSPYPKHQFQEVMEKMKEILRILN